MLGRSVYNVGRGEDTETSQSHKRESLERDYGLAYFSFLIAMTKYLRETTQWRKALFGGSWFQKAQSMVACPHALRQHKW